ncbi:hypothetical protein CLOM_g8601 [Closterium sp. NIES-68]|nr:hypothetical protein CLOM_g8601 [Closterium sp. NIES-68]GJP67081.1 hypothetical protein CLOP_g23952 [Closterium sp. NIES-67]
MVIRKHADIFPDDLPAGLPPKRDHDHKIELEPGAQPTVRTQWRLTQPELDEIRRQLDYLLEKGLVRPSTSPFAAPILFTPKKDGGLQMCIDYRALNRVTIKSRYPIPHADERIDQIRGAKFFSKFDLRGGYHQIRVNEADCSKMVFRTRYGRYEYTLTMNEVFRPLLDKCVIVYLDNILIYSTTREQHLKDLEAGGEQQAAFKQLKIFLTTPPVVRIADPPRPFELITDGSDLDVGAVLLQEFSEGLQPITYELRKLNSAEQSYPVHDKELLAIVHAFKVWRCYLTGADVKVRIDHKSLQFIRAQPTLNPRQICWLDYLESNFHYRVTYRRGVSNIADTLTRPSVHTAAVLITQANPLITGLFTHGYNTDPFFTTSSHPRLTVKQGAYDLKSGTNRIWVPAYRTLREQLIQEANDSNFSGHYVIDKTAKLLNRNYYWHDLPTDVQLYITSCATSQRMKSSRLRPAGLLQPLEPPSRSWQLVMMDFVTGMPAGSFDNDAILVVVDRLTKMAHFAACKTTITDGQTAKQFLTNIVRLHSIPSAIISDRDPRLTSNFWTKTWQQYGTRLHLSTAYHLQSDGQTERTNQTMEQLIRTTCIDPAQWEDSLPLIESAYNNAPSATTTQSPFFLNYVIDPTTPLSPTIENPAPRSHQFVENLRQSQQKAAVAILKANQRAKQQADRRRRDLTLVPGQLVLLDTRNLGIPLPNKLRPRFCGPFRILCMVTPVTAQLQLLVD